MCSPLILLAVTVLSADAAHAKANPVFRALMKRDADVSQGDAAKGEGLPPFREPTMADGATVLAQTATLRKLGGRRYTLDRLLEDSPVAPYLSKVDDATRVPGGRLVKVDYWFVAYGNLDALDNKEFLDSIMGSKDVKGSGKALTAADLAPFEIRLADDRDAYGRGGHILLDKVEVQVTGHSYWSRTDESIVLAGVADPRFDKTPKLASHWRKASPDGGPGKGPFRPYQPAGFYTKITALKKPRGALFVECHMIFHEPQGWFDGGNLLTAKLPAIVDEQVKSARREIARTSASAK